MMGGLQAMAGDGLMVLGGIFMALGALGLIRMPDLYNRIQAATKAVTLGTLALLAGVLVHHPDWWPKIAIIALFVMITSPVGSSTIARAALRSGIAPWRADGDRAARRDVTESAEQRERS